jgi:riboflavin synthase
MFTGLIEEVGTVLSAEKLGEGTRFVIGCRRVLDDVKRGDSIAVNGACQTVEVFDAASFTIFSIPETLAVTNFSELQPDARVNLERALKLGDRIGGHLVQGHVEGMAQILQVERGKGLDIIIRYDSAYIIPKGSVTLNGISLTVMEKISTDTFRVQIIPETEINTNIGDWKAGTRVNIEVDYIIKSLDYVRLNQTR